MADDEITSSIGEEILKASVEEINSRCRLLDNEIKILEQDSKRINGEKRGVEERIKENNEKIKLNKQLPYLVGNIVEILELKDDDDVEDDGANVDLDSHRKGKCTVIKTSTRQTIFLPVVDLVDPEKLEPGDLVGVNKDSYRITPPLPPFRLASWVRAYLKHRSWSLLFRGFESNLFFLSFHLSLALGTCAMALMLVRLGQNSIQVVLEPHASFMAPLTSAWHLLHGFGVGGLELESEQSDPTGTAMANCSRPKLGSNAQGMHRENQEANEGLGLRRCAV